MTAANRVRLMTIAGLMALVISPIVGKARESLLAQRSHGPATLIAAISKENGDSAGNPYSLVHIGVSEYLVRAGKIVRTRKAKKFGGLCGVYAAVWTTASDDKMTERSEGEGAIWRVDAGQWKLIVHSTAGDWSCDDVKQIPGSVRKCLGADDCV